MRVAAAFAVAVALAAAPAIDAADQRKAFVDAWKGTRVVVRRSLCSLVYDEQGWGGRVTRGKREGLTVITPEGMFFRFDGRGEEPDANGQSAQEVFERMKRMYYRSHAMDVGAFQQIQPTVVVSYDPGVELEVNNVRIDAARVRLLLGNPSASDKNERQSATTLTVQWPTPLSPSLSERAEIERLIDLFVVAAARR